MTAHLCSVFDPNCYRCGLAADEMEREAVRDLLAPCVACNGVNGYHFPPCRGRNGVVLSPVPNECSTSLDAEISTATSTPSPLSERTKT